MRSKDPLRCAPRDHNAKVGDDYGVNRDLAKMPAIEPELTKVIWMLATAKDARAKCGRHHGGDPGGGLAGALAESLDQEIELLEQRYRALMHTEGD